LNIQVKINNLFSDNSSGSTELLLKVMDILELFTSEADENNFITLVENNLATFGIIQNFINKYKSVRFISPESKRNYIFQEKEKLKHATGDLFDAALPFLSDKNKIFTLSNSGTVLSILAKLHKRNERLTVTVSESRPQNEGRILAEKLASLGISVNLITEAQAAGFIRDTDCVLLGTDKILANGDVINKTGSLNTAILSKYFNKPLFILGSRSKMSTQFIYTEESHPVDEIYSPRSDLIIIKNNYFEIIPAYLISKLILN